MGFVQKADNESRKLLIVDTSSNNCIIRIREKEICFKADTSHKRSNALIKILKIYRDEIVDLYATPIISDASASGRRIAIAACDAINLYLKN